MFAVACVAEMQRSIDWYTRLVGRPPDDRPMDGLVQWRVGDSIGLQLVLDAERAGRSLITIVTPGMAQARRELAAAALELGPDVQGDFGVIAQISDPDGNEVTLAEPPEGM